MTSPLAMYPGRMSPGTAAGTARIPRIAKTMILEAIDG